MTTDLRGWQSTHLPVPGEPAKGAARSAPRVRARWGLWLTLVVLGGAAGGGAWWWLERAPSAPVMPTRAVIARPVVEPPPVAAPAPVPRAHLSPDRVRSLRAGIAIADDELAKAAKAIATDDATITRCRLKADELAAATPRDASQAQQAHIAMSNLAAMAANAKTDRDHASDLQATWSARRAKEQAELDADAAP